MGKLENEKTYDSVFWTGVVKMTRYLVPLVNEVFGTDYSEKAKVILKPSKQTMQKPDGSYVRGEVDAMAEIEEGGRHRFYHFEVETWRDESIIFRVAEYMVSSAYDMISETDDGALIMLPSSAVIFLHAGKDTKDEYFITLDYPGGSAKYKVPVLKISDYDINDFIDKKLLLLLPFLGFNYADKFNEMDKNRAELDEFLQVLRDVDAKLKDMVKSRQINEHEKENLENRIKRVLEKLTVKYREVQKGVENEMGVPLLIEPSDVEEIREQAMNLGISQGLSKGVDIEKKENAFRMYDDGLAIEKIAQYVGADIDKVKTWLNDAEAKR